MKVLDSTNMDLSNCANRKILEFELIRLEALYRRADQIQFCTYISRYIPCSASVKITSDFGNI